MASTLVQIFTDPIALSLIAVSLSTAAYSSHRANDALRKSLDPSRHAHRTSLSETVENEATFLGTSTALAIPVIATVSLTLLFFFLHSIAFVLTLLSCVSGFVSLYFALSPPGGLVLRRLRAAGLPLPPLRVAEPALLAPLCASVVLAWLFTGHWLANNAIAIALCVLFASLCKVPNLKATVIIFVGLFFYDIFFVFFSDHFFGRNVMVEVATSEPTNPAYSLANYLGLPLKPVENLAMPAKLIFRGQDGSEAFVGMGDIVIPSILMVYLLEIDIRESTYAARFGYFPRAVLAYVVGLTASLFFNFRFGIAQPAMLYIVPCLLVPTFWTAYRRNQVLFLWSGPNRAADPAHSANSSEGDSLPHSLEAGSLRHDLPKSSETSSLVR